MLQSWQSVAGRIVEGGAIDTAKRCWAGPITSSTSSGPAIPIARFWRSGGITASVIPRFFDRLAHQTMHRLDDAPAARRLRGHALADEAQLCHLVRIEVAAAGARKKVE